MHCCCWTSGQPPSARVKSELGWLLFQLSGNAQRAFIYLDEARRIDSEIDSRRRLNDAQRTELFVRLARVQLVIGDYPAAITHSQVALAVAAEAQRPELAALAARSLAAGGRDADSLALYDEYPDAGLWALVDHELYVQLLASAGRLADAAAAQIGLIERGASRPTAASHCRCYWNKAATAPRACWQPGWQPR